MPDLVVEVTKDGLLKLYQQMTTMRRMEMAADALYKAKLVRGFCHLAIGQVGSWFFVNKTTSPIFCNRKQCQSVSRTVSHPRIVLLPRTVAIRLLSCVAGPLKG